MSARPIIRQLQAGILLILLVFSITPKQVLHDWLANHRDTSMHCCHEGIVHFSADGFHCNCDNLVAESPFTHQPEIFVFSPVSVFASHPVFVPHHFYAETHFFFSLRGPPASACL
ncbi:MAG TPA: hypothetical protein VLD19_00260 [Chitinophagaceae bacterium]|nr:hypothetical protein [Chitinophagaceae bacterium]